MWTESALTTMGRNCPTPWTESAHMNVDRICLTGPQDATSSLLGEKNYLYQLVNELRGQHTIIKQRIDDNTNVMQQLKQEITQTTATCLQTIEAFTSQAAPLSKRKRAKPTDVDEDISSNADIQFCTPFTMQTSDPSHIASASASAPAATANQTPLVLQ